MGLTTSNGWSDLNPSVTVLASGDNHNIVGMEYVILVPTGLNTRVTGMIPPDYEHFWLAQIANGDSSGLLSVEFPNNIGSDAGQRTLMPNPLIQTKYILAPGQVVEMIFTPNADITKQGWYPKIAGSVA